MKDRKKYNLDQALKMLGDKKGAGVSKPIKVHVEFEVNIKVGINEANQLVAMTKMFQSLAMSNLMVWSHVEPEDIKIDSYVQTELEDNEGWNLE